MSLKKPPKLNKLGTQKPHNTKKQEGGPATQASTHTNKDPPRAGSGVTGDSNKPALSKFFVTEGMQQLLSRIIDRKGQQKIGEDMTSFYYMLKTQNEGTKRANIVHSSIDNFLKLELMTKDSSLSKVSCRKRMQSLLSSNGISY